MEPSPHQDIDALVINPSDNIAVCLKDVQKGTSLRVKRNGEVFSITAAENIECGHKIALQNIANGSPIIKYSEHIGKSTADIEKGSHVHIHNMTD